MFNAVFVTYNVFCVHFADRKNDLICLFVYICNFSYLNQVNNKLTIFIRQVILLI